MAEFVIRIVVDTSNITGRGAKSGSSAGSGGAASGGGGGGAEGGGAGKRPPDVTLDVSEIRKVFSEFSSEVRAIVASLGQISTAGAQVREARAQAAGAGEGAGASSDAPKAAREAADADNAKADAARNAAKSSDEDAEATRKRAEAQADAAKSGGQVTSLLEEIHRKSVELARGARGAGGVPPALGGPPDDLSARSGTRLSAAGLFANILRPVANDPDVRRKANTIQTNVESFFDIDPGLSGAAKKNAEQLKKTIIGTLNAGIGKLDASDITTDVRGVFKQIFDSIRRETDEAKRAGVTGLKVNLGGLKEAFKVKELTTLADQAEKVAAAFADAQAKGLDLTAAVNQFAHAVDRVIKSVASDLGQEKPAISNVPDASGRRRDFAPFLAQEIDPHAQRTELNEFQQTLLNLAKSSIQAQQPLEVVRELFRRLAGDLDHFEDNVRILQKSLREDVSALDVGGGVNFDKKKELERLFNVRRTASGELKGPGVSKEASEGLNIGRIQELRQSLAGSQRGISKSDTFSFPDAVGNIRRVSVELKQMGNTADSVRVRVKELSDNMFDRASVSTALRRVAVWGSAAGIVFGAINAFRSAVDTVVKTESAVVTLAKVMDEAQVNFKEFVSTATQAAISISKDFGQPLDDVLQTMITFGQQGLTFPEVKAATRASALASTVTTLDQPTAASALTAATEQFGIAIGDSESIVDKFNNVANNAAVTETQLAEAMKRAGSAAVNAGVDIDEFNGLVAAISQQTRQGGSEIGNALRFIFARINTDEAEKGLSKVGVSVRDATGNIRPFMDILDDLSGRFASLTESQRNQVAISVAGGHRFNTFLAIMKNFDQVQQSTANSINSVGSAQREFEKITDTAAFKLQVLKTSAAQAAIEFGGVLAPALKLAADVGSGLFSALSGIPGILQAIGAAAVLGAAGFARFSDHALAFVDLFDKRQGGLGGIAAGLTGGLTSGRSFKAQEERSIAQFTKFGVEGGGDPRRAGVNVARQVADVGSLIPFKGGAESAKSFAAALKEANLELLDTSGKVVKNTENFTKFSAVSRGFSTRIVGETTATTLGIASLNSAWAQLIQTVFKFSGSISRIGGVGFVIDAMEKKFTGASAAGASLVANLFRVGGAIVVITAAVKIIEAIADAVNETGETTKKALSAEIALRQENIRAIEKQQKAAGALGPAQQKAALATAQAAIEPPEIRDERIRQGTFKSPFLEGQRLVESQQKIQSATGFSSPELIQGVDEFGNAVLRSADAFDVLSQSAAEAEQRAQAFTQVHVIEGFIKDLDPATGLKKVAGTFVQGIGKIVDILPFVSGTFKDVGKTVGDKFREEMDKLQDLFQDPRVKEAAELGIDIKLVDSDFAKELDAQALKVQEFGGTFKNVMNQVKREFADLPEGTADVALGSDRVKGFTELAARLRTTETGTPTTAGEVQQQLFLQNRQPLKGISKFIGTSAQETVGRFNEAGFIQQKLPDIGGDVKESLKTLKGGELLIADMLGTPQQLEVVVNEFGERLARFWNDKSQEIELRPLSDIIKQGDLGSVGFFDPKPIKEAINRVTLELQRTISGAARGSLVPQDFDLGASRRFQVTGQQRAGQTDEPLIRDLISARKETGAFLEQFKTAQEEGGETPLLTETLEQFRKLTISQDTLESILRFRSEIEEVGRAFEEAIDQIDADAITEKFTSLFSGVFGAARGIVENRAPKFELPSELTGEQIARQATPDITQTFNRISRTDQEVGKSLAAGENARRNIDSQLRDFVSATQAGGVRDPKQISQLGEEFFSRSQEGVDPAQNTQIRIAEQQLDAQQTLVQLIGKLINVNETNPDILSGGIESSAKQVAAGIPGSKEAFRAQIEQLRPEQVVTLDTKALQETARVLKTDTPQPILDALVDKNAQAATSDINTALVKLAKGRQEPDGGLFPGMNRLGGEFRQLFNSKEAGTSPGFTLSKSDTAEQSKIIADVLRSVDTKKFVSDEGGKLEISKEDLAAIGNQLATKLSGSSTDSLQELGGILREGLSGGDEKILGTIQDILSKRATIPTVSPEEQKNVVERVAGDEATKAKEFSSALDAGKEATQKLMAPLGEAAGGLQRLGDELGNTIADLRGSIRAAINSIETTQFLGPLAAPTQSGFLAGKIPLQSALGKRATDATGEDRTIAQNQDLIRARNEQDQLLNTLRENIQKVSAERPRVEELRGLGQRVGGEPGKALSNEADKALGQLGGTMDLLKAQAIGAADASSRLGDSLSNIQEVNNLATDIDNLFKSFKKQQALDFDRTSIDTAVGKTAFSFVRPTFEQFEQGQSGFLTKFERALEDISHQERTGQISGPDAQRGRKRAEFEQNEDIVGLAQQRETRNFETQVQSAQQVLERLGTFTASGGPGASQAQSLFDQLKRELEQAGDIVPSDVSSRTIRDPRTGQDVNVPASKIMEFRGVRGFDDIQRQVQALQQQITKEENQSQADLINQPIVDTLRTTSDAQVQALQEILQALNENPIVKQAGQEQQAANTLATGRDALQRFVSTDQTPVQQAQDLNRVRSVLEETRDKTPAALESAAQKTQIQLPDKTLVGFEEALRAGAEKADAPTVKDAATQIADEFFGAGEKVAEFGEKVAAASVQMQTTTDVLENIRQAFSFFTGTQASPQQRATGGLITGPGGPRDDKVPVLASPGEFVINAAAAQKVGLPFLSDLNKGNRPIQGSFFMGGVVRKMQAGGVVGQLTPEEELALLEQAKRGEIVLQDGKQVTQQEIEDARISALRSSLEKSRTLAQLKNDEEARAARNDRADRAGKGIRLNDPGLLGGPTGTTTSFDGRHITTNLGGGPGAGFSVIFDENGKPTITNAGGVGIPLTRDLENIDLSSEASFRRELGEKRGLQSATTQRREQETKLGGLEQLKQSRIENETEVFRREASIQKAVASIENQFREKKLKYFADFITEPNNKIDELFAQAGTPEGREQLQSDQNELLHVAAALGEQMDFAADELQGLKAGSVDLKDPDSGRVFKSVMFGAFGPNAGVSDTGEVFGRLAFSAQDQSQLFDVAGVMKKRAADVRALADRINDPLSTFGDEDRGLGGVIHAAAVGAVKGGAGFAEGSAGLIKSAVTGDVKGVAKGLAGAFILPGQIAEGAFTFGAATRRRVEGDSSQREFLDQLEQSSASATELALGFAVPSVGRLVSKIPGVRPAVAATGRGIKAVATATDRTTRNVANKAADFLERRHQKNIVDSLNREAAKVAEEAAKTAPAKAEAVGVAQPTAAPVASPGVKPTLAETDLSGGKAPKSSLLAKVFSAPKSLTNKLLLRAGRGAVLGGAGALTGSPALAGIGALAGAFPELGGAALKLGKFGLRGVRKGFDALRGKLPNDLPPSLSKSAQTVAPTGASTPLRPGVSADEFKAITEKPKFLDLGAVKATVQPAAVPPVPSGFIDVRKEMIALSKGVGPHPIVDASKLSILVDRVRSHIQGGGRAIIHTDGGKQIPVTHVSSTGLLVDAKGNSHGIGALMFPLPGELSGVELRAGVTANRPTGVPSTSKGRTFQTDRQAELRDLAERLSRGDVQAAAAAAAPATPIRPATGGVAEQLGFDFGPRTPGIGSLGAQPTAPGVPSATGVITPQEQLSLPFRQSPGAFNPAVRGGTSALGTSPGIKKALRKTGLERDVEVLRGLGFDVPTRPKPNIFQRAGRSIQDFFQRPRGQSEAVSEAGLQTTPGASPRGGGQVPPTGGGPDIGKLRDDLFAKQAKLQTLATNAGAPLGEQVAARAARQRVLDRLRGVDAPLVDSILHTEAAARQQLRQARQAATPIAQAEPRGNVLADVSGEFTAQATKKKGLFQRRAPAPDKTVILGRGLERQVNRLQQSSQTIPGVIDELIGEQTPSLADQARSLVAQRFDPTRVRPSVDLSLIQSQKIVNALVEQHTGFTGFTKALEAAGTPLKSETIASIAVTRRLPPGILAEVRRVQLGPKGFFEDRIGQFDESFEKQTGQRPPESVDVEQVSPEHFFAGRTKVIESDFSGFLDRPKPTGAAKQSLFAFQDRLQELREAGIEGPSVKEFLGGKEQLINIDEVAAAVKATHEAVTGQGHAFADQLKKPTPEGPIGPFTESLFPEQSVVQPVLPEQVLAEQLGGESFGKVEPQRLAGAFANVNKSFGGVGKRFKLLREIENPDFRKTLSLRGVVPELAEPEVGPRQLPVAVQDRPNFVSARSLREVRAQRLQRGREAHTVAFPLTKPEALLGSVRSFINEIGPAQKTPANISALRLNRDFIEGAQAANVPKLPSVSSQPVEALSLSQAIGRKFSEAQKRAKNTAEAVKLRKDIVLGKKARKLADNADEANLEETVKFNESIGLDKLPKDKLGFAKFKSVADADRFEEFQVRHDRASRARFLIREFIRSNENKLMDIRHGADAGVLENIRRDNKALLEKPAHTRAKQRILVRASPKISDVKPVEAPVVEAPAISAKPDVQAAIKSVRKGRIAKQKKALTEHSDEELAARLEVLGRRQQSLEGLGPAARARIEKGLTRDIDAALSEKNARLQPGAPSTPEPVKAPEIIDIQKQKAAIAAEVESFVKQQEAAEKAAPLKPRPPIKPLEPFDPMKERAAKEAEVQEFFKKRQEQQALLSRVNLKKLSKEELEELERKKKKFAAGGRISGPGGPKSDQVPILASNGEFILNADTVNRVGTPVLDFINKTGNIPFGAIPRFAEGGLVGEAKAGPGGKTSLDVNINTDEIAKALSKAITDAMADANIPLNTDDAATKLSTAIRSALDNVTFPEVEVNTENVSVPLDLGQATDELSSAIAAAFQNVQLPQVQIDGAEAADRIASVFATAADTLRIPDVQVDAAAAADAITAAIHGAQLSDVRVDAADATAQLTNAISAALADIRLPTLDIGDAPAALAAAITDAVRGIDLPPLTVDGSGAADALSAAVAAAFQNLQLPEVQVDAADAADRLAAAFSAAADNLRVPEVQVDATAAVDAINNAVRNIQLSDIQVDATEATTQLTNAIATAMADARLPALEAGDVPAAISAAIAEAARAIQLPSVEVDGSRAADALSAAVLSALQNFQLPQIEIDATGVADSINTAISSAAQNIRVPDIEVNAAGAAAELTDALTVAIRNIQLGDVRVDATDAVNQLTNAISSALAGAQLPPIDAAQASTDIASAIADAVRGIQLPALDGTQAAEQISAALQNIQVPDIQVDAGDAANQLSAAMAGANIQVPDVQVDVAAAAEELSRAITGALQNIQLPDVQVNGEDAATQLANAITTALAGVQLPPVDAAQASAALTAAISDAVRNIQVQVPELPELQINTAAASDELSRAIAAALQNAQLPEVQVNGADAATQLATAISNAIQGVQLPQLDGAQAAAAVSAAIADAVRGIELPAIQVDGTQAGNDLSTALTSSLQNVNLPGLDGTEAAAAIAAALTNVLQNVQFPAVAVDGGTAAAELATALTTAAQNIRLPELTVDSTQAAERLATSLATAAQNIQFPVVAVDGAQAAEQVSVAVANALRGAELPQLDVSGAADAISSAVRAAFDGIQLPAIEVDSGRAGDEISAAVLAAVQNAQLPSLDGAEAASVISAAIAGAVSSLQIPAITVDSGQAGNDMATAIRDAVAGIVLPPVSGADAAEAISAAVLAAIQGAQLPALDAGQASNEIAVAISDAFRNIQVPEVQIDAGSAADQLNSAISTALANIRLPEIAVDGAAAANELAAALATAVRGIELPPLDASDAAAQLAAAIQDAMRGIRLPDIKVDTKGASVPVDVPPNGIRLDTAGLQGLGDNLGAAVRNRLESVEGSVTSLREDTNNLLDTVSEIDLESINLVSEEVSALKNKVDPLPGELVSLGQSMVAQKQQILDQVFTMLNEQLSNLQLDSNVVARLDKHIATTASDVQSITNQVNTAIQLANRALTQALARK